MLTVKSQRSFASAFIVFTLIIFPGLSLAQHICQGATKAACEGSHGKYSCDAGSGPSSGRCLFDTEAKSCDCVGKVVGYDFSATSLAPPTVAAGGLASSTVTFKPDIGYKGTVQLTCSATGGGGPPPACVMLPLTVNTASPTTTLTVQTTGANPGKYSICVIGKDQKGDAPHSGSPCSTLTVLAVGTNAATPVIETILRPGLPGFPAALLPYNPSGDWDLLPAQTLMVRLRAPHASGFRILVDGTSLQQVFDNLEHPELDVSGYFAIVGQPSAVDPTDPSDFFVLRLVLPIVRRFSPTPFEIDVVDVFPESSSAPAVIKVRPPLTGMTKPGDVFFANGDNPMAPEGIVARNVTLAGWLGAAGDCEKVEPTPCHNVGWAPSGGSEDWHYELYLDNDFIARNYDPDLAQLTGAKIPRGKPITLISGPPTAGTFTMPFSGQFSVELNAWHKRPLERGKKPDGWVDNDDAGRFPDDAWPFDPVRVGIPDWDEKDLRSNCKAPNDSTGRPTRNVAWKCDYVIVTGTLWEDFHKYEDPLSTSACWDHYFPNHRDWLEIHPVDAIRVIRPYAGSVGPPTVRKHVMLRSVCAWENSIPATPWIDDLLDPIDFFGQTKEGRPAVDPPPPQPYILQYRELVDDRFTDMSTVGVHTVEKCLDHPGGSPKLRELSAELHNGAAIRPVLTAFVPRSSGNSRASSLQACGQGHLHVVAVQPDR